MARWRQLGLESHCASITARLGEEVAWPGQTACKMGQASTCYWETARLTTLQPGIVRPHSSQPFSLALWDPTAHNPSVWHCETPLLTTLLPDTLKLCSSQPFNLALWDPQLTTLQPGTVRPHCSQPGTVRPHNSQPFNLALWDPTTNNLALWDPTAHKPFPIQQLLLLFCMHLGFW